MTREKVRENSLRRKAKRLGLEIRKSRAKTIHLDDLGGYRIIDPWNSDALVWGERFELELDDVEQYLNEYEEQLKESHKNE